MSLSDYQQTYSWQGAIELGPYVVKLAEQLPAVEQTTGLGQQLRVLMVELPGAIALDLIKGSNTRLLVSLRLAAALELIERIYPALDAADAKTVLSTLVERLTSDTFDEAVATPPGPEELAHGETTDLLNAGEVRPEAGPAAGAVPAPAPVQAQVPMPAPVQAQAPAPAPTPAAVPFTVPVPVSPESVASVPPARPVTYQKETHTIHVQPDSGQ